MTTIFKSNYMTIVFVVTFAFTINPSKGVNRRMESVPITTDVVSSNLHQSEEYNIM
jgi:hypothetical protein